MTRSGDWRPRASLEVLRLRAALTDSIREFFARRNVLEVETPAISTAGNTDPNLDPITARAHALGDRRLYLATSPEYAMKRLLAAGSGDIYQICRVFRDGELGRWHQPEFTLLEWYRVGWDDADLMNEVDELLRTALAPHRPTTSTLCITYRDAFRQHLGTDPFDSPESVARRLNDLDIQVPQGTDEDGLLDLAMSAVITPQLDSHAITFVHDFPSSQAALARIRDSSPPVAARFEAFTGGLELANGYHELTDAAEQRERFETERRKRSATGRAVPPLDHDLLAAIEHGLPDCAGVAVGVDRLVAVAAGLTSVAETFSFAH